MNALDSLLQKIKAAPETVAFQDVIAVVDKYYNYSPTQFKNGKAEDGIINKAGENEGSCKVFSFAKLHGLDESQTLQCFGQYYREDVLANPDKADHANIRNFMKYGWSGISFEGSALGKRQV